MKKRSIFTAVAAAGLIAFPATASVYASPVDDGNLDHDHLQEIFDDMAEADVEAAVAEVRYGDEVWTDAFGNQSLEVPMEAEPTDRVRVASISKSMVGVIGLQLQAEGKLDLDDNVSDYLPDALPYDDDITLRQLLNHSSGMSDHMNTYLYPDVFLGDWELLEELKWQRFDPDDHIDIGTQDDLQFDPGANWAYSNTGYTVFGLVVEEVTGNDIADEFEQRVFEPAGMDATYQPGLHEFILRGQSLGAYFHTGDDEQPYVDTTIKSLSQLWTSGSVVSNPQDVNAFYRSFADGTLLNEEQYAEALEFPFEEDGVSYGLGVSGDYFGCPSLEEGIAIGHGGGGIGHESTSLHSLDGEKQITLTYNTNTALIDEEGLQESIMELAIVALCGDDVSPNEVEQLAEELTEEALEDEASVLNQH